MTTDTWMTPDLNDLVLPCAIVSLVCLILIFIRWYTALVADSPKTPKKGLPTEELHKLRVIVVVGDTLTGTECAICLDQIESGQLGLLLPGCNHGFHQHCADAWLSKNHICPLCRTMLHVPADADKS